MDNVDLLHALNCLTPSGRTAPADIPMTNEEISLSLTKLRADLAARSRAYAASLKAADGVLKAMKDPAKNAVELSGAVEELKKNGGGLIPSEEFGILMHELEETAQRVMDEATFSFGRDLRSAFEAQGLTVSGSGDRFVAEPFLIELDKKRGRVDLKYGRESVIPKPVSMDPVRVFSAYSTASKSLTGRKISPAELLKIMFEAYGRAVASAGLKFGDRVNIADFYREVVWLRQSPAFRKAPSKNAFTDYPRTHFAYDVNQLQRGNTLSYKGHRLQLGAATIDVTGDESRSMWIASGAEEGRYVMDVYWVKEG